jgi:hypothetical protein
MTGFLLALGVQYRRLSTDGSIRFEISPSAQLPDDWRGGGKAVIGEARNLEDAEPLHLGHALIVAAVAEARGATPPGLRVGWTLDGSAPAELSDRKGKRGRLILLRIRYDGFEKVDRLIPIAVAEGSDSPLAADSARWLLDHPPYDRPDLTALPFEDGLVDDFLEELVFSDQIEVACDEQRPFERKLEQVERYVEDQLMVLRRRLSAARESLRASEDRRDAALGADLRSQAESRVRAIQEEIDGIEGEVVRLETRDDAEYQRWRQHVQVRREKPPEVTRLLDVEFVLE